MNNLNNFNNLNNIINNKIESKKEIGDFLNKELVNFTFKIQNKELDDVYNRYKAAKTIQNKFKQNREKTRKNNAAKTISRAADRKLQVNSDYLYLSQILCTIYERLEVLEVEKDFSDEEDKKEYRKKFLKLYRKNLKDETKRLGNEGVLKNLFLFYCNLSKLNIGSISSEHCIKEIKNSIFINSLIENTTLINIDFTECKFLGGTTENTKTKELLKKLNYGTNLSYNKYLYDSNNNKIDDLSIFSNTFLNETTFTNCEFYKASILNIKTGNYYQNNKITSFSNCNFSYTEFKLPFLILRRPNGESKNIFPLIEIEVRDNDVKDVNGLNMIINNINYIKRYPGLLFDNCKFNNCNFNSNKPLHEQDNMIQLTKFIKCDFEKDSKYEQMFKSIYMNECYFESCNFTNLCFYSCDLNNINFKDCIFKSIIFNGCRFATLSCVKFDNCKFLDCNFSSCLFNHYLYINKIMFIINNNCVFNNTVFSYCDLTNVRFNYFSYSDKKLLDMKKCKFICCNLYSTNFDYCDLEGCDFSERQGCATFLSKSMCVIKEATHLVLRTNKLSSDFEYLFSDMLNTKRDITNNGISQHTYKYDYREMLQIINKIHNINPSSVPIPFDYFKLGNAERYYYFMPPTSFYNSNLKSCKFQRVDGFQNFDFTKIAKNSQGHPELNGVDFTLSDLTEANFTNCNLIGTLFRFSDLANSNFTGTIVNENTEIQDAIDFEMAIGNEHINIDELRLAANETHARANFIIQNRKKIIEFFIPNSSPNEINGDWNNDLANSIFNQLFQNSLKRDILINDKLMAKITLQVGIRLYIETRLEYEQKERYLLKENIEKIISDEFINLVLALQTDSEGKNWFWLELILYSLNFAFTMPKIYLNLFVKFYLNEVFNAHGPGSMSCTKGMIERFVSIHSQTIETIIMTFDIKGLPDDKIDAHAKTIQNYYSDQESELVKLDPYISSDYLKCFNKPSINESREDSEKLVLVDKYKLYSLLNLLKPDSNYPESEEDDIGIVFDNTIKPEWRDEFHEFMKTKLEEIKEIKFKKNGDGKSLEEFFIDFMKDKIKKENGITEIKEKELIDEGGLELKVYNKQLDILDKYLNEVEIPQLIISITMSSSLEEQPEISYKDIVDHFFTEQEIQEKFPNISGGSLKDKTVNKVDDRRFNKIEDLIIKKFINLSKEKIKKLYSEESDYMRSFPVMDVKDIDLYNKKYYGFLLEYKNKVDKNYNFIIKNITIDEKKSDVDTPTQSIIDFINKLNTENRKSSETPETRPSVRPNARRSVRRSVRPSRKLTRRTPVKAGSKLSKIFRKTIKNKNKNKNKNKK